MQQMLHQFVIKKRTRLRICALIVLLAVAGGMLSTQRSEPAEANVEADDSLSGFVVALDPGHGGYDGGARAHDSGLWEKEITLQIALATEQALLTRGATVILTRREDTCLAPGGGASRARKRQDLQARMDLAEEAGADVLLSIHLNEYRSRLESGPQVFYQRGGDAGRLLAGVLQEALVSALKPQKERVAMAGDYYVLRGRLPSALVECGFLSNADEEKLLLTPAYQCQIAAAIANGLAEYRALLERTAQDGAEERTESVAGE